MKNRPKRGAHQHYTDANPRELADAHRDAGVLVFQKDSRRLEMAWKWQVISKVGWGARIALQHVFLVVLRTRLLYFKV